MMENTSQNWVDTERAFSELCKIPDCLKYARQEQEDIGDLLRDIINHWKENNSNLYRLFEGSTRTDLRCKECAERKNKWENFGVHAVKINQRNSGEQSLEELLSESTLEVDFKSENKWK